jgi:transcriptional regulator with XRE-family HTH domain
MHKIDISGEVTSLIKERRNALNLTQKQLADLVGVDRTTISKIENGIRPSVNCAKKIAQILGLDWTIFFDCTIAEHKTGTA